MSGWQWTLICRFMVAVLRLLRNPGADVPLEDLIETIRDEAKGQK